jgi:hypothetical protein
MPVEQFLRDVLAMIVAGIVAALVIRWIDRQ